MSRRITWLTILLGWNFLLLSGCGSSPPAEVLPPGTPVSGQVGYSDLIYVVYAPKDGGKPHRMNIRDNGETVTYRSAVPPGEYTVYAYITGARAEVQDVTVGESEVTVDIPESLTFEESRDEISGMPLE